MNSWAAAWLCLCVYLLCECCMYSQGNNTLFWRYTSPEEIRLQEIIITKRGQASTVQLCGRKKIT